MPSPAARKSAVGSPRSAARLFASSCVVVSGLLLGTTGCEGDSERADKAIYRAMKDSAGKRGEAAVADLQKAAQTADASPAASAQAKVLLAQAQVEQARDVLREVQQNELTIARLAGEITSIAGQIQNNNAVIAGFKQLAPKTTGEVAKLLDDQGAQAQGKGAEDVWKLDKGGQLPAASNARARAEKLQPEVKALEDKRAELGKARADADKKANDLLRQSRRATGKASLDAAVKAAAENKRAADIATQIARVDDKLAELQQDIALANAQAEMLEAAAKGFSERAAGTREAQAKLEALIKTHQELSNTLVYGTGGDSGASAAPRRGAGAGDAPGPARRETSAAESEGTVRLIAFQEEAPADAAPADAAPAEPEAPAQPEAPAEGAAPAQPAPRRAAAGGPSTIITNASMSAKAKELSALVADTAAKRQTALGLLTSALTNFDGAIADAQKLRNELTQAMQDPNRREAPQQEAWKAMAEVYSPVKLNLQKANVQHLIASVQRDAVASMAARKQMLSVTVPALEEAEVRVPAELESPQLEKQLAEAQTSADEAYAGTLTLLQEQVIDAPGSGEGDEAAKKSGAVTQVVAKYGQAQLARAVNNDADAKKYLSEAVRLVKGGGEGATLQADDYPEYLRRSLGLIVAPPTTAPSTRPTGAAPGTAPAPGATPTAPPATSPAAPPASPPAQPAPEDGATEPAETPAAAPAADPATTETPAPADGAGGDLNK